MVIGSINNVPLFPLSIISGMITIPREKLLLPRNDDEKTLKDLKSVLVMRPFRGVASPKIKFLVVCFSAYPLLDGFLLSCSNL